MSVQHANRGVVKKDLQLYYNREFVKSFRGEATINTCNLNSRYNYVWANGVVTRDTTAPSPPPITGFEIAKLRSTDGADTQTILYTAAVDQVNGGVYTHSAYIYLESGTWASVGQHWNPWDYGVQTSIPLNKWTRISYTVTNTPNNYGNVACAYNTNGTIYITATQYEKKSYSTPFVNGSRTANTVAGGGGLLDISGNNVNVNLTTVAFDSAGYYFTTAGSNYINTGITTLPSNTQLTIDVWTKPTSTTQAKTLVSKWGSSSQSNFCFLLFLNLFAQGNIYFLVGDSAGTNYSTHSIAHNLSTSVYSNFTIVYDNGLISWYRNGVFVSPSVTSANTVLKTVTTAITIGADYDGGNPDTLNRHYDGTIPNVRLYSRPLTAAEVLQNFNATRTTYGI